MSKTGGPRRIVFAKIQQATAEKAGEPVVLEIGDLELTVPTQTPLKWQERLAAGDLPGFLRLMFGADGYAALVDAGATQEDVAELLKEVGGVTPGESSGSSSSSTSTGTR
jgi:hypothetical protein